MRNETLAPQLPSSIPSLNGLRAVAILLVVIGHVGGTPGAPAFLDIRGISSLGNVGVRLFFVISGFLITTLLLRDVDRHGQIRLRDFYVRRSLRILPAFFAYVGIIWALYLAGVLDLTFRLGSRTHAESAVPELLHAITFTQNYNHDYNWYFNHLWSLAVEEQFYLLWPFCVFFLGVRRALIVGVAILFLAPVARMVMYALGTGPEIALSREFQAVADALATGCVAAMLHNAITDSRWGARLESNGALVVAFILVAIGYGMAFKWRPGAYLLGGTLANLGMIILLQHVVRRRDTLVTRLLNLRPMVAIGILSYSLYLWQEPFLYFRCSSWACSFPQNVVLTFAVAAASYYLVEKPFLALKERFSARAPLGNEMATDTRR